MRRVLSPLVAAVAMAACSDSLPVETDSLVSAKASTAGSTEAAPRHIVLFGGNAGELSSRVAALGGSAEYIHEGAGIAIVSGLAGAKASSLANVSGVELVADDFTVQLTQSREPSVKSVNVALASSGEAASQANPTTAVFYPMQWNHPAVGANVAWARGALGSSSVRVAILDSGIDYLNPDLNGLVDLTRSASFVPSDNVFINVLFPGRHLVSDLNGHGTFVGSIVSSKAIGNAGVTSRVTLIGVKVLGVNGTGTFSGIMQGIVHAVDNGADVINMSLGIEPFPRSLPGAKADEKFVDRLTKYARDAGVTVIVASGNDGLLLRPNTHGLLAIFCSNKNVICVSATGPLSAGPDDEGPFLPHVDLWAAYSNHGKQALDVAAPGGNGNAQTSAAVWGSCSRTLLRVTGNPPRLVAPCLDPSLIFTYGGIGTSAAAPHVAGLAALLVERMGRNPAAIEAAIRSAADDVPFGKPGNDDEYGHGRINVARALGLQ